MRFGRSCKGAATLLYPQEVREGHPSVASCWLFWLGDNDSWAYNSFGSCQVSCFKVREGDLINHVCSNYLTVCTFIHAQLCEGQPAAPAAHPHHQSWRLGGEESNSGSSPSLWVQAQLDLTSPTSCPSALLCCPPSSL